MVLTTQLTKQKNNAKNIRRWCQENWLFSAVILVDLVCRDNEKKNEQPKKKILNLKSIICGKYSPQMILCISTARRINWSAKLSLFWTHKKCNYIYNESSREKQI